MNKKVAQGFIGIGILVALYGLYTAFFTSGSSNYAQSTATAFIKSGGLVAMIGGIILGQLKKKELSPNSPETFNIYRVLIVVAIVIVAGLSLLYVLLK